MQMNKRLIPLCIIISLLSLFSCSTNKHLTPSVDFQTLSQRGQATLEMDQHRYTMNCAVRVWANEMIVLSLQPMLGIEMVRIEADIDSIYIFDKMNRRYTVMDYTSINRLIQPKVSYKMLQDFATGQFPIDENGRTSLSMQVGKRKLVLSYKQLSSEMNTLPSATQTNKSKYTFVTLREILPL